MMSEQKDNILQDGMDLNLKEKAEHLFGSKKQLTPWISVAVLLLLVIVLAFFLNSNHRTQKEMAEQLTRQQKIIEAWDNKTPDSVGTRKSIPVVDSQTVKSQLASLQELVTQEYIYTNADKRTQDAKWLLGKWGPGSKSTLILTYDGIIKAGIDMSKVTVEVNEENRTITVTLPDSEITDNNIPQDSITVVESKDGLFNEITLDDYNTFISEQKIIMEEKAIERGLLEKADKEAQKAIEAFLALMPQINGEDGYKLVVQ